MVTIKKYRLELLLLLIVLGVGAFLRLYRISEYMMFLGDEGRDAMVVRRLLMEGDLVFVGPGTSIGNMYLGPLYYYLIAPALLLANFSPVGPSILVALLGVATIYLVWYVVKQWTGNGFIAGAISALYATSPVVIIYSRSSWNPNIMPFFALLTIYSLWQVWQEGKWPWLVVMGISFAFVTQSHYLGLLLLPTILLFWLISLAKVWKKPLKKRSAIIYSSLTIFLFGLFSAPLVIFDAKYHWRNLQAAADFLFSASGDFSFKIGKFIPNLWLVWQKLNIRLLAGTNFLAGFVLAWGFGVAGIVFFTKKIKPQYCLLFFWLIFGLLGLALYKSEIYDHYFGFLFPALFILLAGLLNKVSKLVFLIFVLVVINLFNSPIRYPPNRQLQRAIQVAEKIKVEAGGEKYNFAVIADKNYEGAYQYFLELWRTPLSIIDPQRYEATVAEQLFVVCEYPAEKCQPASNPKAGVANFGWSKVEKEWEVGGARLYKLVHNRPD